MTFHLMLKRTHSELIHPASCRTSVFSDLAQAQKARDDYVKNLKHAFDGVEEKYHPEVLIVEVLERVKV